MRSIKNVFIVITAIAVFSLIYIFFQLSKPDEATTDDFVNNEIVDFSVFAPEVEDVLYSKLLLMQDKLSSNSIITDAIIASNTAHNTITQSEIMALDQEWIDFGANLQWVEEMLNSDASSQLQEFKDVNRGVVEFFVTDKIGLNVAMSNMTSDYYQADEVWWQNIIANGNLWHGQIEYDESAKSEAVSIYTQIFDENGEIIGVAKCVIDLLAIIKEL